MHPFAEAEPAGIADVLRRLRESERPFDVETLVTTATRRLRLRRLLVAIERNPKLLEEDKMATPKLQGLAKALSMLEHNLEQGAGKLMTKIEALEGRGLAAIAKGDVKLDAKAKMVGDIETFVTALEGANGGDPLDDSSDTSEKPSPKPPEAVTITADQVGAVESVVDPEQLTVNGVSLDPKL